jgi:hypothetical protein
MSGDEYDSVTEPLRNGDPLPAHPRDTTAKEIAAYGFVYDADNGTQLTAGLHRNELDQLQHGNQMALTHLYRYCIIDRKIYHTCNSVVIHCKTMTADEPV